MRTLYVIGFFGVFVLFSAGATLWRRAADYNGLPFSRRCILALSASRNWWIAYSVGALVLFMGRYEYSFQETFPVVLVAIGLAALLFVFGVPR
jgi:hypothetical protein